MGKAKLKVIIPVWAKQIEIEKRGDSISITGWGHTLSPFKSPSMTPGLDILQRLRNYALQSLGAKISVGGAGVYQFADAHSDEALVTFCREFGPVRGKVKSITHESEGTYTLVVVQQMKQLREEQKKFAGAVSLLQQITLRGKAERLTVLTAIQDATLVDPNLLGGVYMLSEVLPLLKTGAQKTNDLLAFARTTLCGVLNGFAPTLFDIDGEVIEVPESRTDGILSALYFQLRLDFLAQRMIGTCINCGSHFAVFKRGTRVCGPTCSRAVRNRKYWNSKSQAINRTRRREGQGVRKSSSQGEANGTQEAR